MMTFEEAVKATVYCKTRADAEIKAERHLAFLADMATDKPYLAQAMNWAEYGIVETSAIDEDLSETEMAEQVTAVMLTLVNSVFTWGLNVGRLMEEQKMPDA